MTSFSLRESPLRILDALKANIKGRLTNKTAPARFPREEGIIFHSHASDLNNYTAGKEQNMNSKINFNINYEIKMSTACKLSWSSKWVIFKKIIIDVKKGWEDI